MAKSDGVMQLFSCTLFRPRFRTWPEGLLENVKTFRLDRHMFIFRLGRVPCECQAVTGIIGALLV